MSISQKGQKRYENFIKAGLELFLENGYEGTSLNDIVSRSGGSLASVYKFFNNKEGLFIAILEKRFEDFSQELDKSINLKETNDPREFLYKFALAYIEFFYRPDAHSFSRILISEGYKHKELGKMFFDGVLLKVSKILIDFLEKDEIKPMLKEIDGLSSSSYSQSELLAYKFCALVREPFYTQALLLGEDAVKAPSKKKKEEMAKAIADLFLNGVLK